MREIKFRAWDKNKTEMREGLPMVSEGPSQQIIFSGHAVNVAAIGVSENADWILMQFTGLKDKNGKEIYEGDIIGGFYKPSHNGKPLHYEVLFGECRVAGLNYHGWLSRSEVSTSLIDQFVLTGEIIGNIYQNSELLK